MEQNTREENPQIIYSWKAPLRPYKKRSRNVLRFYLAITLLLSFVLFFFGDKTLLVPMWAILFLFYVLTITPPPVVDNKITKFGLETAGITVRWEAFSHFYFLKRFGFDVLVLIGNAPYYYHAYLVIPDGEVKKKTLTLLTEHLVFQETPRKGITEKMIDFFTKLIPDEDVSSTPQPASV